MKYRSTAGIAPDVTLKEAVVKGLAPDRGLYMPERIPVLPESFFKRLPEMSLPDIASEVATALFGEDVDKDALDALTRDAINFDIPLVKVDENKYSLELFHGPTLAFKDVGARFMARLLTYFNNSREGGLSSTRHADGSIEHGGNNEMVNVLVATSGDTGSAVANGFFGVEGTRVFVLYPKGKVSKIQESQFATLGKNIIAIEVDGTFDDCQALVKQAFLDPQLNREMNLTSANSINVARFLPQMFYYFNAWSQLAGSEVDMDNVVFSVPSGNFGNITAGLIAKRMGLPIKRFIAANNANDVFYEYLKTREYRPRRSVLTIANAMDVGDPSNFARVLDLYNHSHAAISAEISGCTYTDREIAHTISYTLDKTGYLLDPHGATAFRGLNEMLRPGETGIFLETAHPAKFKSVVDGITGRQVEIPPRLRAFMQGTKQSIPLPTDFSRFKSLLLSFA